MTTTAMPFAKALNAGLRAAMTADDHVLLMGEDIGKLGGVFRDRGAAGRVRRPPVLDTPLAESGSSAPRSGSRWRVPPRRRDPVRRVRLPRVRPDHLAAREAHEPARGRAAMPVVIRIPYGGTSARSSTTRRARAYFAHTPGLRVVSPSTPNDAYWMIQDAIASPDPVIFLEPKAKYWLKGEVDEAERALPLHASRIVRRGTDVTLVGHGAMVTTLLQAAALAESEGTSCEVVDLRSLSPIDYGPILDSVRRTGRMVYAQEAPGNVSVGSEVAATVMERAFFALESPVIRVSGFDVPFPPAKLEGIYLPDADRILEAVDRALAY
jgi:pyruvate dehydrogenase E1 component beta subunit